jgi:hypothetical protein
MTPGIITFDYSKEFLCKKFVNYPYELLKFKNSTIILSARYSWYLLGEGFDNKEGGIESRKSKWVNNEAEIRQHNKELVGGARYTSMKKGNGSWTYYGFILGLDKSSALSIEKKIHLRSRKTYGATPLEKRINCINNILKGYDDLEFVIL